MTDTPSRARNPHVLLRVGYEFTIVIARIATIERDEFEFVNAD